MAVATAGIVLTGCSSTSNVGSTTPPPTAPSTHAAVATPWPTSPPTPPAQNLLLTKKIRHQLLLARAKATHLPDDAFVRLYKGSAYYAHDNNTGTYWAAGSTVPNHHYLRAEVYTQDEGAYTIFVRHRHGEWKVYDAGRDGPDARSGAQCPVKIPADVLKVWHWAPNTCDPPLDQVG
ncbi:MAG TPA: hypothetical protein VHE57_04895 [Mycobacteriales bacterium]|nr:hypothetical protein [Mycobacteriales bacterium]